MYVFSMYRSQSAIKQAFQMVVSVRDDLAMSNHKDHFFFFVAYILPFIETHFLFLLNVCTENIITILKFTIFSNNIIQIQIHLNS